LPHQPHGAHGCDICGPEAITRKRGDASERALRTVCGRYTSTVSDVDGRRTVLLRDEHDEDDSRYLTAQLEANGDLRLSGQDLGPGTWMVSSDGEYEWEKVVPAAHIPTLLSLLDAPAGADILDELAARWTGARSYDLERRIRDSDIPVRLWTYGR
jgi:hypothetical protein